MKTIIIVGGGLVGALEACYIAKKGFQVELYEMRQDIRKMEVVRGRSINLALSVRGIEALKRVGLEKEVLRCGIPMYARMIHDRDGKRRPIPYGRKDQCINSVDRRHLNELLLTAAEAFPNVTFHFEHKLQDCDFDAGSLTFQRNDGSIVQARGDLIIGCDGAFSAVRRQMMKKTLFDYEQVFIPHGYMELSMPPTKSNEELVQTVMKSKALPMVSVKCSPYHVKDKAVIIGDAAHAMVPFYGQGMNCGFEDCIVLDDLMTKHGNNLDVVLSEYTKHRSVDAKAMCDLALYNYIEMRQSVNSWLFLLRKQLDNCLYWLLPAIWMPLYTSVSFSRTRYHICIKNKEWQDKIIKRCIYTGLPVTCVGGYFIYKYLQQNNIFIPEQIAKLVGRLKTLY